MQAKFFGKNALVLLFLSAILLAGCVSQPPAAPGGGTATGGAGTGGEQPSPPAAKVEVINSFSFVAKGAGFLKAFAEIKNTGTVPVKFVGVTFHYTDSEGNPATSTQLADVKTLESGDTSPASVVLAIGLPSQTVTATIADFDESEPLEYKEIKAFKTKLNKPSGYAAAVGYAKNTGNIDWQKPFQLVIAYYDTGGNMVGTGIEQFPNGLKAGESKDFSNTVTDDSQGGIADFKLWISPI